MDISNNAPMQSANAKVLWLWYTGSDAICEGEAVCYDIAEGVAANYDGKRHNRVARPSTANNLAFAGVAARNYPASSVGQFIEVYGPGSRGVKIALGANTVINTGFLTFTAGGGGGAGRFVKGGFHGRGSAFIRQTVAAGILESDMTGAWSLATDGKTLTVAATAGIAAGDTVVLLGGEDEGSGKAVVPGKYTVASITSGTVLVLTASAVGATPGGALTCTGYAYSGNPTCQADLMDGEESGGVEFVSPPNAGNDDFGYMIGGVTYVCGGVTLAADVDFDLADGTMLGEKKGFVCLGTMTTSDVTVDLDTAALPLSGDLLDVTDITAIDAAGDAAFFEWNGVWIVKGVAGGATQTGTADTAN